MPAYVIVLRTSPIQDEEAYNTYVRMNEENPPTVSLKPLVLYGAMQALEGEAPDGVVMLEFDSVEDAKTWYESPSYQAALPYRLKCGDWRAFIVDGI